MNYLTMRMATLSLCAVFMFVTSCQEAEQPTAVAVEKQPLEKTATLDYIIAQGYSVNDIEDVGDRYVVEGDIGYLKKTDYWSNANSSKGRNQHATFTTGIVSQFEITNVTVSVNANIPTSGQNAWRTEIQQAINDWNDAPGNTINFVYITSGVGDIEVRQNLPPRAYLGDATIAQATPPTGAGLPGSEIQINFSFRGTGSSVINVSSSQKRRNMVHELGHCIGLRHTNWSQVDGPGAANQVLGTPCSGGDPASVMNGNTALTNWSGLSTFDVIAVQVMYPTARPAGLVPFFRYVATFGIGDHFYTWNWNEVGCGSGGYKIEGIEGYLYTTAVAGTVPIHRYYNGSDHFYTRFYTTYAGYTYEAIAGYGWDSNQPGTIPIHRYVGPGNDHFYSKVQYPYPDYSYEGIAWYAYP